MPDASPATFTAFEYRYRDAANYKVSGRILLSGTLTEDDRSLIAGRLQDGEYFVAEQVGIPPLYQALYELSDGPTEDDHGWHEFVSIVEPSPIAGELWGTTEVFLSRFQQVTHWDLGLSELSSA